MSYKSKIVVRVSDKEIKQLRQIQLNNTKQGIRESYSKTIRNMINSKIE